MKIRDMKPLARARHILEDVQRKKGLEGFKINIRTCRVRRDGNYTVALVNSRFIGVAKRNPVDQDDRFTGESYAISRAVKNLVDKKQG